MFIFSARFSMQHESTTDIHRYPMILGPGPASADPPLIGRECFLFLAQLISWQLLAAGGSWWLPGAPRPRRWSMTFWKNHGRILGGPVHRDVNRLNQNRRIVEEDEEFGNSNLGFFGFWSMMIHDDPRFDDLIHPKWSPGWVMLYDVVASGLRYQHSVNSSCLPSAFSGLEKVSQVDNLCQCMFSTHVPRAWCPELLKKSASRQ